MIFMLSAVPEGRLFALDSQTVIQIVAAFINVAFLAFVLAKLLYNPVRGFMQARSDRIRADMATAKDEMQIAEALRLQYERRLKEIGEERYEILEEARKQAVETANRIVSEAKSEADSIKTQAKAQAESELRRVQDDVRQAIIEVSGAMSEKFVAIAMDKETHDRLFAETMAELDQVAFYPADHIVGESTI